MQQYGSTTRILAGVVLLLLSVGCGQKHSGPVAPTDGRITIGSTVDLLDLRTKLPQHRGILVAAFTLAPCGSPSSSVVIHFTASQYVEALAKRKCPDLPMTLLPASVRTFMSNHTISLSAAASMLPKEQIKM